MSLKQEKEANHHFLDLLLQVTIYYICLP